MTKLEYLNLGSNKLSNLPDEIFQLISLQYLSLSENLIIKLPFSLSNLRHLEVLDLEDNYITKLPEEFSKLQNLTYLDIRRNKLKYLPKNIGVISKLAKLYLYHNFELKNLPRSFTQLTNLEELKLENFSYSNLTFSILTHLTQLNTKLVILKNSVSDDLDKYFHRRQI